MNDLRGPDDDQPFQPGKPLRAAVGDTLVIQATGQDGISRTGEIIAVIGPDGSPPYRVRWLVGEYESLIMPGPGAHVQKGH